MVVRPRLTLRETMLAKQLGAPLEHDVVVPAKRERQKDDPGAEWRVHTAAVKLCREWQRAVPTLRYICAMPENRRDPKRAGFAKMMGLVRGVPDMILMRRSGNALAMMVVEFKRVGAPLSEPQQEWFDYFSAAGVECHRVDDVAVFGKLLEKFCSFSR